MKHPVVLKVASGDDVEPALPGRYRSLVTATMRKGGPATLVIFGDAIARLRQVEGVLADIVVGSGSTVLAFANDITAEAKERLEDAGIVVSTLRGFGWREERHPALRSHKPPN